MMPQLVRFFDVKKSIAHKLEGHSCMDKLAIWQAVSFQKNGSRFQRWDAKIFKCVKPAALRSLVKLPFPPGALHFHAPAFVGAVILSSPASPSTRPNGARATASRARNATFRSSI